MPVVRIFLKKVCLNYKQIINAKKKRKTKTN